MLLPPTDVPQAEYAPPSFEHSKRVNPEVVVSLYENEAEVEFVGFAG